MRDILVINPVATEMWNRSDFDYLKGVAREDTRLVVVNISKGPATIESFYDTAYAVPDLLGIIRECRDSYAGIMINCFADPGLIPARELCDIPVVGPGESAMVIASLLGHRFSVISTQRNVRPMVEMKAASLGLAKKLASVEHIDIPVCELEKDTGKTVEAIVGAVRRVENEAEVVVLGCTGMLSLYREVARMARIPVVEPAQAALKLLEALIDLKLVHSKQGLYLYPVLEKIKGY